MRDPEFEPAETEPAAEPAPKREPAFNLPGSLVAMLVVLASIQALRSYVLPIDMDEYLLLTFSFIPARYTPDLMAADLAWLWSPVTYSLLHGGWEHLIFNGFWMVAFGAPSPAEAVSAAPAAARSLAPPSPPQAASTPAAASITHARPVSRFLMPTPPLLMVYSSAAPPVRAT